MKSFEETVNEYDYAFDPMMIATEPASPRDGAQLLVYHKKDDVIFYDTFANVGKYLPPGAVLVMNDTKVFPARLHATKKTGGYVEVFYIGEKGENMLALTNRFLGIGEKVYVTDTIFFECLEKKDKVSTFRPSFPVHDIQKIFKRYGETPIPPYIKNSKLSETELRKKYQTVFAKNTGSVAAPTASLHFTKPLLSKLKKQGIDIEFITLHVNLGTFAPLSEEAVKTGKLHKEWYEVPEETAKALTKAKAEGRPIIAVGTTVVRTLEQSKGQSGFGETELFIHDPYSFKYIDGMITNFHVPKSSLLLLVATFVGREKLLELYRDAMKKDFRLFSFGDGMLLL